MPLKSRLQKWPRDHVRLMHQQLRFHAMNSRRLLQRLDHMRQQPDLHFRASGRRLPLATNRSPITPLLPS